MLENGRNTLIFTAGFVALGFLTTDLAMATATQGNTKKDISHKRGSQHSKADMTPESVTVVAQRRNEAAQDVPISLTVISASQLARDAQLRRINDVVKLVPNAQAEMTDSVERPRWFIRGIGTNSVTANTVNPVGIYFDDVYIANVYNQGYPLYDQAQVEVLRGPQGTLWGKNANGGAINYISKAPEFKKNGYAQFGYGSFNHTQEQAAIGGTLLKDKVAGRLAFYGDNSDGWQTNLYTHKKMGGGLDTAARGQLLIKAAENLSITLNAHFRRYVGDTFPSAAVPTNTTNSGGFGNPATRYQPGYNTFSSIPSLKYNQVYTDPTHERVREFGGLTKVVWNQPKFTVTSITAAETNARLANTGATLAPAPGYGQYSASRGAADYWQATQETRIASKQNRRLTWMGGIYGFIEHLNSQNASASYYPTVNANGVMGSYTVPPYSNYIYNQNWLSGSVFGNAGYKLTKKFTVSAGLRWSVEHISINDHYYAQSLSGSPGVAGASLRAMPVGTSLLYSDREHNTYRNWTADVTLQYAVTAHIMPYFRFASGKMPGNYGFSGYAKIPGTSVSAVQLTQINPETITAYELGIKTQWLHNRLTINADGFRYNYDNALVNVPTLIAPGITSVIFRNAGAAVINGAELQIDATPLRRLHLGGNLGILSTQYTSEDSSNDHILGARIPRSPHVSLNGYVNYDIPIPVGNLKIGADFQYYSRQFFFPTLSTQTGSEALQQRAYALLNAHVTWFPLDSHKLSFDVSVLNIANQGYKLLAIAPGAGVAATTYGQPRSFFFQGRYSF